MTNLQQTHLNIPPHLKYVATLPCEICQKTGSNLKYLLWLMINDKVVYQAFDVLIHYKYVIQFAGERICKIGEHLEKLQTKWLTVSYAPFALDVCSQRRRTRQISKITCV